MVNVSSGLGSLTYSADPESRFSDLVIPAYFSSKAALNMLTLQYARAYPGMRINAADPGFTATDLNDHRGTQTVTEGTDAVCSWPRSALTARPAPSSVATPGAVVNR